MTVDLAGGQHDWIRLQYERCRGGRACLDDHRQAIRRGHLPTRLRAAKQDAERIICQLHAAGASKTAVARLFDCNSKTIARIVERVPNVSVPPYRGTPLSFCERVARRAQTTVAELGMAAEIGLHVHRRVDRDVERGRLRRSDAAPASERVRIRFVGDALDAS